MTNNNDPFGVCEIIVLTGAVILAVEVWGPDPNPEDGVPMIVTPPINLN